MDIYSFIIGCLFILSFVGIVYMLLNSKGELEFDFDLKAGKGKFTRKSKR